jgi:LysM repeat protein
LPRRIVPFALAVVVLGVLIWIGVLGFVLNDTDEPTPTLLVQYVTRIVTATMPPTATPMPATNTPQATDTPQATQTDTPQPTNTAESNAESTAESAAESTDVPPTATIAENTEIAQAPTEASQQVTESTPLASAGAASGCTPPEGWIAYTVQPGDTLFGFQLGSDNTVNVETIRTANCLSSNFINIGQVIYLPPGAAENAPKVDDSPAGTPLPPGLTRTANCPCTITVRVGWRLPQIAAAVDAEPVGFTGRDLLTVAAQPVDRWFVAGRPGNALLEGFMYPGTYTLENATTATGFRDMMLDAFEANVGRDVEAAVSARGLTMWQAVNLASIVQRESYTPEEQAMIAQLFYNRMGRDMGLGTYVTLQYAYGVSGAWWGRITREQIRSDTPYNTLRFKGLPPTPISNPSREAIYAVANPTPHDYLYFSAKCSGGGNFYTRTFEEFERGLACEFG